MGFLSKDNTLGEGNRNGSSIMRNATYISLLSCLIFAVLIASWSMAQDKITKSVSYLDLGYYKIYQFTEDEIQKLNDRQLTEILRIYADRFYPFYMFLSRNYFSPMLEQNYSILTVEPVFKKIEAMNEVEKKQRVRGIFYDSDGVTKLNKELYLDMRNLIGESEIKKVGKMLMYPNGFAVYSPDQILQAYQFKMGLLAKSLPETVFDVLIKFIVKFKVYFFAGVSAFMVGVLLSFLKGKTNRVR